VVKEAGVNSGEGYRAEIKATVDSKYTHFTGRGAKRGKNTQSSILIKGRLLVKRGKKESRWGAENGWS